MPMRAAWRAVTRAERLAAEPPLTKHPPASSARRLVSGRSRSLSWSPDTTSTSSTPSRRSPTRTGPSSASPGSGRRAAAPTRGTSCTRRTTSSYQIYRWLLAHGEDVLTGDSFFHLNTLGEPLPGLNMCGAGRVVCLIDPIGDVYACPFVIHDEFKAGSVRDPGSFTAIWRESELFLSLREPASAGACASCGSYDACQGGCMAAKFFTGLPLDGPDPECVNGHGEPLLAGVGAGTAPARRWTTPAVPAAGDVPPPLTHPSVSCRRRGIPRPVPVAAALGCTGKWLLAGGVADRELCGAMRLLEPLSSDRARRRTASCSARTSPTSVTTTGCFTARHTAYYERGREAGAARSSSRGRASTSPTGPTSGRRWQPGRAGLVGIAAACRPHGALVVASLDHAGGQGSSAYSQTPAVGAVARAGGGLARGAEVDGGRRHRRRHRRVRRRRQAARRAGCDGVEVNAGQHSLVRQFLSGLTNQRGDEWGADRLHFARTVITAVRAAVGGDHVVGLRLSCDEIAPWAGITPEMAPPIAADLVARRRRLRRRRARVDLLRSSRPVPTSTNRPGSTSASPRRSPPRSTCRSCSRARSSTSARPSGRSAATTTRPAARRWR